MENTNNPVSRLNGFIKPHKKYYILSIVLAVLGVASSLIPFYAISKIVILLMEGSKDNAGYINLCIVCAIGFLFKIIFSNFSTLVSHTAAFETLEEIRLQLCDKLIRVPMGYMVNTPSGQLKNIIVDRVEGMEAILAHLVPEMSANLCIPIFILIYLFILDFRMALASLITLPIGFLCYKGMARGYEEKFKGLVSRVRKMTTTVVEYIKGIEVIKAFNQSASSYGKLTHAVNDNAEYAVNWMKSAQWFKSMSFTIWPSVLAFVLPIGYYFTSNGSLSIATFITCIVLSLGIVTPILSAISYTDNIAQLKTVVSEVCSVLDEKELVRPDKNAHLKGSDIEMKHVYFSYDDNDNDMLLKDVNLKIPEKTITAFVGPSGGGKSTITKIIAGFWEAAKGSVEIGSVDVKNIPIEQLMDNISYISQENYLFDETIRENIRLGKPGAADEEVEEAAKKCGCHEFISKLENGYDTIVGGSGGHLSGGERQRVAIARAMIKDAPIVILDEATAYIDAENEALIQEAMAKVIVNKTVLMIAHRLSTITDVDKIVVVKDGHIEAEGKHEELLKKCPLYQKLWKNNISTKDEA